MSPVPPHSFGAELHLQRAQHYARASTRFGLDDHDVPAPFLCPISFQMMRVPFVVYSQNHDKAGNAVGVVFAHSYERAAILRWSKTHRTNPVNSLRAIGGAVNLTLLVKIRAWITYCSAALSAYTEDAAPAWVGSLRDLVAQYVARVDAVSDDATEFALGATEYALGAELHSSGLVRPVYGGEWTPTPCAARAEVHGPFGAIVLVQSMSSGFVSEPQAKTFVDRVRGIVERVETQDATLPAHVLPVHVAVTHETVVALPAENVRGASPERGLEDDDLRR